MGAYPFMRVSRRADQHCRHDFLKLLALWSRVAVQRQGDDVPGDVYIGSFIRCCRRSRCDRRASFERFHPTSKSTSTAPSLT